MGISDQEMTMAEIGESVPPAYAEYIGRQVMALCKKKAAGICGLDSDL